MVEDYKSISARKIKERDSKIPKEWRLKEIPLEDNLLKVPDTCGILTERELEITGAYDSVALLEKIHRGGFTAKEVTIAFCKRSSIAQQLLNCLTEVLFDEAIKIAEKQDDYFNSTSGRIVGPLHGLPISMKDSMNIKGVDSSIGIASLAFKPEEDDSGVTHALVKAGAILFCKTNIPQSMMVLDTDNFIFGRARNPHSQYITTAGSSGGAGALVAFRGSLVGMATDIGGSIRVPAYANGVYGFKPSSGRVPYYNIKGYWPPGEEYNGVICVAGPIAVSMRDCHLILKTIAETEPWNYDPTCPYSPWPSTIKKHDNNNQCIEPLSIGVVSDPALEPVKSILEETCKKIKAAGHELIEIKLINNEEIIALTRKFFQVDGGKYLVDTCARAGEPLTSTVLDNGYYPCESVDLNTFFQYSHRRVQLQKLWHEHWQSTAKLTKSGKPVDALLMPVSPIVPRVREFLSSPYIKPWNFLDYPSLVS